MKTIAVVGGTGAEGSGLALRWASAGHRVIIGSRDAARAEAAARELREIVPGGRISGAAAPRAAADAEIVVVTVPFAAQLETVRAIRATLEGKILVDVTAPLVPPQVARVQLPESDSCVVRVQREVGENVQVVSAFQNAAADKLRDLSQRIDCDVLVCSDFPAARQTVIELAIDAGMRGVDAGPLANSVAAEALTSVLIWINRRYKARGAGVMITGIPEGR